MEGKTQVTALRWLDKYAKKNPSTSDGFKKIKSTLCSGIKALPSGCYAGQ